MDHAHLLTTGGQCLARWEQSFERRLRAKIVISWNNTGFVGVSKVGNKYHRPAFKFLDTVEAG